MGKEKPEKTATSRAQRSVQAVKEERGWSKQKGAAREIPGRPFSSGKSPTAYFTTNFITLFIEAFTTCK